MRRSVLTADVPCCCRICNNLRHSGQDLCILKAYLSIKPPHLCYDFFTQRFSGYHYTFTCLSVPIFYFIIDYFIKFPTQNNFTKMVLMTNNLIKHWYLSHSAPGTCIGSNHYSLVTASYIKSVYSQFPNLITNINSSNQQRHIYNDATICSWHHTDERASLSAYLGVNQLFFSPP